MEGAGVTTLRWTFTEVDTSETYTVPINPDAMTSPFKDRSLEHAASKRFGGSTAITSFRHADSPKEWEFSGVIRTQAHHDALKAWEQKPGLIHISDHLGRVFEVMLTSFAPTDRKPTGGVTWRLRYVMKALVLRQVS